jgi:hypothetical protein
MSPDKILTDLIQSASAAKAHYEVWWAQASEAKPGLVGVMNKHSDFFRASYDAHYMSFFVYLAHLFDKRADSSSIPSYFTAARAIIDQATLQTFEARYSVLEQRATPILTARHKTVAHIDARLSEKDVFAPLKITWKEVHDVISDSCCFVADLASLRGLSAVGIPRDRRLIEATLRLIHALKRTGA